MFQLLSSHITAVSEVESPLVSPACSGVFAPYRNIFNNASLPGPVGRLPLAKAYPEDMFPFFLLFRGVSSKKGGMQLFMLLLPYKRLLFIPFGNALQPVMLNVLSTC